MYRLDRARPAKSKPSLPRRPNGPPCASPLRTSNTMFNNNGTIHCNSHCTTWRSALTSIFYVSLQLESPSTPRRWAHGQRHELNRTLNTMDSFREFLESSTIHGLVYISSAQVIYQYIFILYVFITTHLNGV